MYVVMSNEWRLCHTNSVIWRERSGLQDYSFMMLILLSRTLVIIKYDAKNYSAESLSQILSDSQKQFGWF